MDIRVVDGWSGEPSHQATDEIDALAWVDLAQARELHLADPRLLSLLVAALS
jgi:hypothetical protein